MVDPGEAIDFQCGDGRHSDCLHVPFHTVQWTVESEAFEAEGEFRIARMAMPPYAWHDTTSIRLCRCLCHQDCPMAEQESADGWPEACACPGALRFLKTQTRRDLGTQMRASLDRSRRTTQARRDLRHRAKGLRRDQVEDLLDVVWGEHELPAPDGPARPALIDQAMGLTSPLDQARTTVDVLQGTGRWIGGIIKVLRGTDNESPPMFQTTDFRIEGGNGWAEVDLDADAQPRLGAMGHPALFASRTATMGLVELREGSEGSVGVWERSTGTNESSSRFGVLPSTKIEPYRRSLAAGARVGQVVVCTALRMSSRDGGWRLYVALPRSIDDRP
jgi:hypothetical protein